MTQAPGTTKAQPKRPAKPVVESRLVGTPNAPTPDLVRKVADRMAKGVPLRYALAVENTRHTPGSWEASLAKRPALARLFDQKIGAAIEAMLVDIADRSQKWHPGQCWVLERRFGEYFAPPKSGGPTNTTNITNNLIVSEDVRRRIAALIVGKREAKRARQQAKAIDVVSEVVPPVQEPDKPANQSESSTD